MPCHLRILVVTLCAGSLAASFPNPAHAEFIAPNSWTRGDADTTYQHWNWFITAAGATPDLANINPNGTATLTETSGNGFPIGSGNIYAAGGPASFEVSIPLADQVGHDLTSIVQIRTQGTELDINSLALNGTSAVGYFELARTALGGFGGTSVDHWFLFNVPYADYGSGSPGTADLSLTFGAVEAHLSLSQIAIDTATSANGFFPEVHPIPEPSSLVLLGLAAAGCFALRRRAC